MSTPSRPIVPEPAYAALVAWLRRARDLVAASAPAIDAINVFPAPDADTGTNVTLTLTAVVDAADAGPAALGGTAVVAAHGNSGAVIGQMVAVAAARLPNLAAGEPCGRWLAATLREATAAATAAVADPVRGTVLTVAAAAAEAAADAGNDPLQVARAAERAASEALDRTTDQLAELRAAGVVDAGGLAFLLLLRALVEVLGGEPARPLPAPAAGDRTPSTRPADTCEYEVMYLLDGAEPAELDRLRTRLSELADSVVVVTARTPSRTAKVHAHLTRPAQAIAPGLAAGTVSALRVTPLGRAAATTGRRPLVIVDDPGQDDLVRAHGGRPVPQDDLDPAEPLPARLAAELAGSGPEVIIVLPATAEPALRTAIAAAGQDRRVELISCTGSVPALSALAVHEPTAGLAEAAAAMRLAAARVRTASAGSAADAWSMITTLAAGRAELITVIADPAAASANADLGRRIAAAYPGAEIELLTGRHRGDAFLIGVEP
ncbi:DAK2 domain-containing protein [Microlunatus sp. GCM10028923]|uniref:DAK2 domain-containing protein n=1 Tax=Microlunatus sp. GCM10028923 TaxID=3273400 RepID=UPI003611145D